ncbi:MAG: heparan-alpha-glucosaminide N-acetyltransferase domain-containing protein [Microscillaceae bacterium]|jgi:predicted acyltransferase|nr:heparan-alpha-glucosaminide N-acetyltransferase domain-containing protein [Microscillaceae bacterium]
MNKSERLLSLDIFRGITVAAMILVNNPGSWSTVYSPLLHAKWDGCTPTDLIFPFFLFIVGVSIHLALSKQKEKGIPDNTLIIKALQRGATIFALGLFLAAFPFFDLTNLRIPGVLQRIGLVFIIAAIIYVKVLPKNLPYFTAFCLLLYWFLMTVVPVPGVGAPNLQPETNLGAWLDRLLLDGHLWKQSKTWDPEGVLGTIPAVGTSLLGIMTGQYLSQKNEPGTRVAWLFVAGSALVVLGMWWGLVFPINKALWTSSYVLYTGGLGMMGVAICYWLIDVQGYTAWIAPFRAYGINAISAYVLAGLVVKLFLIIKIGDDNLYSIVYQTLYASWLSPYNASLAMAVSWVLLFLAPLWRMYKKNIIIKV